MAADVEVGRLRAAELVDQHRRLGQGNAGKARHDRIEPRGRSPAGADHGIAAARRLEAAAAASGEARNSTAPAMSATT